MGGTAWGQERLTRLGGGRALLADPLFFHDLDPWRAEKPEPGTLEVNHPVALLH